MSNEHTETLPEIRPVPRSALPVVEYSTPPTGNVNASRALVWALLGFLPFVPGMLAVRYGRRGVADAAADPRIGGRSKARVAQVIGVVSLCAWVLFAVAAVPAVMRARRAAQRVQCMSQLRQISVATMMYATANRGFAPTTLDDLVAGKFLPASMLNCPATVGDPTKPPAATGAYGKYGYVYLGGGRSIIGMRNASGLALAYEPPTNHAEGGVNVAFFDGHVEWVPVARLAPLIQQSAPPATRPATLSAPPMQPAAPTQPG